MSMLYKQLDRTGLVVSQLAYGAMTFPMGKKARPTLYKTDEAAARAVTAALARKPGDPA